ncbi:hypothetical protein WR25_22197 isoform B [Diploscapter pachys]|uniref:Nuclear cap-binding protein subunit 1 n=1 Tax=Diploscapter pachys TaxID=2018661 RepID=A0A2A2K1X5_9BILA|nr:hypothetical protein WR25_22197 isoform B [Diploscapter pachys]
MLRITVLALALFGVTLAMRDQSIAIHGKLLCGAKPASNVRDDLLDQGYTDGNGEFNLKGGTAELTPIDPVFKLFIFICDDGIKPGMRKVKFALPKSYITEGQVPKKTFDIGILNLETIFAKEERELIVSRKHLKMSNLGMRRRHEDHDDDGGVDAKRRRAPPGVDEVQRKLEDVISRVGDKEDGASLENNLEKLCNVLDQYMENYRSNIIEIMAGCVVYLPEKLTIYSTVVGILNARNFNFGGEIVEKLTQILQDKLDSGDFNAALNVILFLCDLGNSRVLTLNSIVEFIESMLQLVFEEKDVPQVRIDWLIYAILHALPWIGSELKEKKPDELNNILEGIKNYIQDTRKREYLPLIQVWCSRGEVTVIHEQEDYLDCLWAQINKLKEDNWKELHIPRHHLAFESVLQDALQHNLPAFSAPVHREESQYPFPYVVFRLFDYADCPDDGPVLPGHRAIERFLIEEEIRWIIENNGRHLDKKSCAKELAQYAETATNVPIAYMILEVVLSQMFKLPSAPLPQIFYHSLLLELCKLLPKSFPFALAQAIELVYQRADTMQPIIIDRVVDWFSFHLSNFQYRWSWEDWYGSLAASAFDPKHIFTKEIIEKCLRLSYYDRLKEFLPDNFGPHLPPLPEIRYTFDDPDNEYFETASKFSQLFQSKATDEQMLEALKGPEGDYERDAFGIFFSVLLKLGCKTYSHVFAALSRYHHTLKTVSEAGDELQLVLLQALYACWKTYPQTIQVVVDKMLKMQVLDCAVVFSWLFSADMKHEMNRQWLFDTMNTALSRLSRHINKVEGEYKDAEREFNSKDNRIRDRDGDEQVSIFCSL